MQGKRVAHLNEQFYRRRVRVNSINTGKKGFGNFKGYLVGFSQILSFTVLNNLPNEAQTQVIRLLGFMRDNLVKIYSEAEESEKWLELLNPTEKYFAENFVIQTVESIEDEIKNPYMSINQEDTPKQQRSSKYLSMFFISILILAIITNIIQFNKIDNYATTRYKAIYNYPVSDIYEIAFSESPPQAFLYSISYALGEVSNNANLILPINYSFLAYYIEGVEYFGNLSGIERVDYNFQDFLDGFDPTPFIILSNEDMPHERQYRIALSSGGNEFILIEWYDEITLFLETSLLTERKAEELSVLRK